MSDKIYMSLDEIIKSNKRKSGEKVRKIRSHKKDSKRPGQGVLRGQGRGGIRRKNTTNVSLWNIPIYKNTISNTQLIISNLDFGVSDNDIRDLFSEFRSLTNSALHYDKLGRPLGIANVNFYRRSDAINAIKLYNGVALDGRIMNIQLAASEVPDIGKHKIGSKEKIQKRRYRDERNRNRIGGLLIIIYM